MFFFDTLSRAHFHRKFNKTSNFLSQFSRYEPGFRKKNLTIFEFFKYHSLAGFTDPNIKAAYYNTKINDKKIHFDNFFKKMDISLEEPILIVKRKSSTMIIKRKNIFILCGIMIFYLFLA